MEVDKRKGRPRFGAIQLLLAAFLCLLIVLSLVAPNFLTFTNITNILRQVSMIAIMAVGMTMVILTGEIDLSVGSMVAFSGVVFAWLAVEAKLSCPLAALITLAMGAAIGLLIGWLQTRFNVPSFIITLGLFQALRSAGYVLTNAFPIAPLPDEIAYLGRGVVAGIPVPVILMIIAYVIGFILLNKTTWGRTVYAVGSNAAASELSGIDTRKIKISVFTINSFLAALAGLILASRLNSGTPTVATGWELDVIAAVIIGGTAMSGGSGNILGTLLGAMFVAVLNNGMILMGVSPYVQGVISGLVIVAAVLVGSSNKKRS